MKYTHKIKAAIKLLKEIDAESKNNYFTINNSKYFVKKNTLYANENFDTPVGSIKNGIILLKSKSRKTAKSSSKRKMKSSKPEFETFEPSTFVPSFKPVIDSESIESNSMTSKLSNSNKSMTNKLIKNNSLPFDETVPVTEETIPSNMSPTSENVIANIPTSENESPNPEEPFDEHAEDSEEL